MSHNMEEYAPSLRMILEVGENMLKNGSSARDVVEHCVSMLEDEPLYNAGRGSVLNSQGEIEMDASIMNGKTLSAGAVAAVRRVKNPIRLARMVMEKSRHVMLIAEGAMEFAHEQNAPTMPDEYFLTESRHEQWKKALDENNVVLDHSSHHSKKLGTVGAVAMDTLGDLAAATSTGGLTNKKYGRVGDTPIIGAGCYADNETCAVSATGIGEHFIRTVLAKTISEIIRYEKVGAGEAAKMGIDYLVRRVEGLGGVIVIDKNGRCGSAFSTPTMIHGSVCEGGEIELTFNKGIKN